jgi:hypothetical protein
MGRASIFLLAGLALLIGTAGCSLCGSGRRANSTHGAHHTEPELPEVERNNLEPDLLALASTVQPAEPPGNPRPPSSYRVLSPAQCQCLAAQNAPAADSFDRQRQKLQEQRENAGCLCQNRKSENQNAFQEGMLLYSSLELRDQFAGQAMEWFYQLAGAEAKADLLDTSLVRARDTLTRMEDLKKRGIRLPAPVEEYQRQIIDLQLQQAQNQLVIEQLNSKLRQALAFDPGHAWRFWPDAGVPLGTESIADVEAAVQTGLAQRPQLLLLRHMIANLDKNTIASARYFLSSISPILGMATPAKGCKVLTLLGKVTHVQPGLDEDAESIRAQLIDYLKERERVVAAEVREAAYEVRARRELTILARETTSRWQDRIKDLEKQRGQGMPVFGELTTAYMEWYKARGEVVTEFLGWKIAALKVKQAQGILPAECGYTDHSLCAASP